MPCLRWQADAIFHLPVRDPLLCFATTLMQAGEDKFDKVLADILYYYDLLFEAQTWFECEYLWLDAEDREAELEE